MLDGFRFANHLRVRFNEADVQQVVFNGNYMVYFDHSNVEYMRHLGLPYHELVARHFDYVLVDSHLRFHRPARFDDLLAIHVRTVELGRSKFIQEMVVTRENETTPLVSARNVYVGYDIASSQSLPLPDWFRQLISDFEDIPTGLELVDPVAEG